MAIPVGNLVDFSVLSLLGCQYGKPSRNLCSTSSFFSYFFSVSGKVLPVTPLLSSAFVHRVFCAYYVRFEGAGVIRRFPWCNGVESRGNADGVLVYL